MTIAFRHTVTATGIDDPNRQVSVNAWNANHLLTGTANTFLGFNASGNAVEFTAQEVHDALTDFLASERTKPVGFVGTIPFSFQLWKRGDARAFTTNAEDIVVNPLTTATAALTLYVDAVAGNDANPGTSSAAPKASLASAMSKVFAEAPASVLIYAKGNYYNFGSGFGGTAIASTTISIVSWNGLPVYSTTRRTGLTWTLTTNGTYSAPLTSTHGNVRTWDSTVVIAYGGMSRLSLLGSRALVEASTGGAMYHDTGANIIYVRTFDGREPDAGVWVFDGTPNAPTGPAASTYYFENIHFWGGGGTGGGNGITDTANPAINNRGILKAKDCSFAYTNLGDNFAMVGAGDSILLRCQSFCAHRDGLTYYRYVIGGGTPRAIEVDCQSYRNGFTGDGNNNGSTAHNGMPIVRVNGGYFANQDRNIHDVNGGDSWNLGVTSYDTQNTAGLQPDNANFMSDGRQWLDTCTSSLSATDIIAETGGTTYTFDFVSDATSSGTITAYTPT